MAQERETLIFAHRGASYKAPENTMEAFRLALEEGADGIELDVHLTADDVLVVLHNDTVDATSNGQGAIASMTLAEAKALDFSNQKPGYHDVRIPALDEVFAWAAPTGLAVNVEIKPNHPPERAMVARVAELAAAHGMLERVIISWFHHEVLREAKRVEPSLQVGALYHTPPYEPQRYARDNGFDAVHPHFASLSLPGDIRAFHEYGVAVRPYTVDAPEMLEALMRAGTDAVITNMPARAASVRGTL